jgi:hypothetical protein
LLNCQPIGAPSSFLVLLSLQSGSMQQSNTTVPLVLKRW